MEEKNFKTIVGQNLVKYRKHIGLTQLQLAEKLNYSDKAISKWERGDGLPDLEVMNELAKIFGCNLANLFEEQGEVVKLKKGLPKFEKIMITSMATVGIWVLALITYMLLNALIPASEFLWLAFIYAIPSSFITVVIFNCVWGKLTFLPFLISGLVWALGLCLYLTFPFDGSWLIFIIIGVMQIIGVLWFNILIHRKKKK